MSQYHIETLADLRVFVRRSDLSARQKRDIVSAIKRVCELGECSEWAASAEVSSLRSLLRSIRHGRPGITPKTAANLRSLIGFALKSAGHLDDVPRGLAMHHPDWSLLVRRAYTSDKGIACGLTAFAGWCAHRGIKPRTVNDCTLQEFMQWLETQTLHPAPRDLARRVPVAWNRAGCKVKGWPQQKLAALSFKLPPVHLLWDQLPEGFRRDLESYLATREECDFSDECSDTPNKPLAKSTLRLQREHLRIAASVLIKHCGAHADRLTLASVVEREAFKAVLLFFIEQAKARQRQKMESTTEDVAESKSQVPPNAFVIGLATTLIQVAHYYVGVPPDELLRLKRYKAKLTPVPFDLTEKSKQLLRELEVPETQRRLLFLPALLQARAAKEVKAGRLPVVETQIALAIDLQLVLPMRPQNLISLNWQRHFADLGSAGLRLTIPKAETKSKKMDIVADIPEEVAKRLNWYRRNIRVRLGGCESGNLFVTRGGKRKDQRTLAQQIVKTIRRHVGVHMTPHQFRHFAAVFYLEHHPQDFETRALLARSRVPEVDPDVRGNIDEARRPRIRPILVPTHGRVEAAERA